MRQDAPLAPAADQVVGRATALLGDALVGVVLFGSWARGQQTISSDIDVLVVAGRDVPITRALYRRWDEQPIVWKQHAVEPHFAQLPDSSRLPSGFWAEVASHGRVLLDARGHVAAYLAAVRDIVASGRLCRRKVHGHPYWVEN